MRRILDRVNALSLRRRRRLGRSIGRLRRRYPQLASECSDAFERLAAALSERTTPTDRRRTVGQKCTAFPPPSGKKPKSNRRKPTSRSALLEEAQRPAERIFTPIAILRLRAFLPGYNFPRLPLYAYVPAIGGGGPKAAYLQRARFIAIAEFGPRSLIYHEGRAYRVYKAKLPPNNRAEEGGRLATDTIYICDECGAAHQATEPERCHVCRSAMGGIHPIRNVLRIDNVETWPAERITANDEDRQRQGFEIQTVFAWS